MAAFNFRCFSLLMVAVLLQASVQGFSINKAIRRDVSQYQRMTPPLKMVAMEQDQDESAEEYSLPSIDSMRVKEMQAELKERNISYADCFDKESLGKRLQEARDGRVQPMEPEPPVEETGPTESPQSTSASSSSSTTTSTPTKPATPKKKRANFDRAAVAAEFRAMRVRELREACAKRRIRWAQFVEKEELVQALVNDMEFAAEFSVSGQMQPGEVTDLTDEQLREELSQSSDAPLLLDIYATWCGPCQMMAPQLQQAAEELGDKVRVGKLDSDKYPVMAQQLKAGGLPTVLVLNGSEELQRIEGALMKDQILKFVEPYVPN